MTGSGRARSPAQATPVDPTTGPVPKGLAVADLTFVVPTQNGWALGTTSKCAHRPCTSLVRTTDGGQTWVGLAPPVVVAGAADGCTVLVVRDQRPLRVNAASATCSGPRRMYLTTDGGAHWVPQAGGAVALEIAAGNVLRVTTTKPGCKTNCALRRPAIGRSGAPHWTTVLDGQPEPPGRRRSPPRAGRAPKAFLQIDGDAAGGVRGPPALYARPTPGRRGPSARSRARDVRSTGGVDATAMTPAPDGALAVCCAARGQTGHDHVADLHRRRGDLPSPAPRRATLSGPVGASARKVLFVQVDRRGLAQTDVAPLHRRRHELGRRGDAPGRAGTAAPSEASSGSRTPPPDAGCRRPIRGPSGRPRDAGAHWTRTRSGSGGCAHGRQPCRARCRQPPQAVPTGFRRRRTSA